MEHAAPRRHRITTPQEEAFHELLKLYASNPKYLKFYALRWAFDCIAQGIPRVEVCIFLLDIVRRLASTADRATTAREIYKWKTLTEPVVDTLRDVEARVSFVMEDRNTQGQQAEKEGNIEEAIQHYESNLNDGYHGSFPYERLRIIYVERKDYVNAIRVCETALRNRVRFDPQHLARLRQLYKPRI